MAGVPTTEDLYVGFGATEFMTNMDVQRKESSGTRGYRLIHTISQCIEVDAICTISCSTHTTATHMIKAAVPAVTGTDAEGNSIEISPAEPAEYCSPGTAGAGETASCSCGASTVSCPNNGAGMCGFNDGAPGCVHNQQINHVYPHAHTYVGTISQPIANGAFSTSNKSLSGPTITFSKSPPFSTMWHSNGNSAANWSPTQ
jgi:hypothetical protein